MQIKLIEGLHWDMREDGHGGLCNLSGDKIHLRQGDMDGACGPYCLVMAMLARNQLTRGQARGFDRVDARSRYGRLMQALNKHETLVRVGTTGNDLMALLAEVSDSQHLALKDDGVEIIRQTRLHLSRDLPVLLGFHGHKDSDIRHWGLAIGMSEEAFFLLDPAHELSPGLAWNAFISTEANGSRFGYRYINPQGTWAVTYKEMLALL